MRRKYNDLLAKRAGMLTEAEGLLKEGKREDYRSKMTEIENLNSEITEVKTFIEEQDRKFLEKQENPAEARDKALERADILRKGGEVKFEAAEVRKAITLATTSLAEPTGAGSNIRDPLGNVVSSIVDQVYVQNLTGMGSFLEPYVISEIDAKGGKVTTNAGKARTTSADPTLGVAKISPYELNVTQFVDRNISRLSPADYYTKIYNMAMRAMRRKLAALIVNGDGQASPDMFGIKNAKNVAGAGIAASVDVSSIDENLLDDLFFSYGSDEAIGQNARLLLNKADLKAIGKLRNSDKQRVFKINPATGNPNVGTIEDGGNIVPYTIVSDLTALSASTAGSAAIQTMLYGDPANYELGLFGDYTVRVDDSVKAVERMFTILGDAMVGGNLIVNKGFVIANLPKSGG